MNEQKQYIVKNCRHLGDGEVVTAESASVALDWYLFNLLNRRRWDLDREYMELWLVKDVDSGTEKTFSVDFEIAYSIYEDGE